MVVREEGPDEGLFEKEHDPPPPNIHNSNAPSYAPGDPIKADILNAPNWSEDIAFIRNQELEVDDEMDTSPNNIKLVDTPATDTLFKGHT